MYSSLLILKKKYTAANTEKRNTEANVINNYITKKKRRNDVSFLLQAGR